VLSAAIGAAAAPWQAGILRAGTYTIAYSMVADLYKLPNLSQPYRTVNNGE
jgi:hypothetical protein